MAYGGVLVLVCEINLRENVHRRYHNGFNNGPSRDDRRALKKQFKTEHNPDKDDLDWENA